MDESKSLAWGRDSATAIDMRMTELPQLLQAGCCNLRPLESSFHLASSA